MSERKKTARTGDCPAACDKNESAKAQKKTSAKKKVRTALMSTVIALSASAIAGLSVALYYSEQRAGEQQSYISSMEAVYSRSYYDLLDSANDLEVQLMKLRAAGTPEAQSRILYDVWQTATSASQSLAAFEGEREGVMKANKFLGQLGDYARVLAEKLADGEGLTASEAGTLEDMRGVAAAFKDALADTRSGKEEGRLFLGDGGMLDGFSASFDSFAEPDFDYPSMIYDGPFSDALEDRECKALRGLPAVSAEEGAAKLAGMIRGAENIKFRERTESDIVTLSYTFDREGGSGFAQLTEQGGLLALCDISLVRPPRTAVCPSICAPPSGSRNRRATATRGWCGARSRTAPSMSTSPPSRTAWCSIPTSSKSRWTPRAAKSRGWTPRTISSITPSAICPRPC